MKKANRILILLVVMVLLCSFVACTPDETTTTPTKPVETDPPATKPNVPSATMPSDPTQPTEDVSADGLSKDGKYYQLTDKNGVIVRIPIGKALNVGADGKIKASAKQSRSMPGLKHAKAEETEAKTIYVFSKLSVISFGYGNIKHPVTNSVLGDPSGTAFGAEENQVLVMQFTDEDLNAVAPGSNNAVYLYFWVLNYTGQPGKEATISFASEGHLSADGRTTYSYFEFSQNTISFGTPYTAKSVYTLQDEFGNLYETIYRISEEMRVIKPGEILTVTLTDYYCDASWTPYSKTEYTYTSDYDQLAKSTKYDMQGRALEEIFYEDGVPYKTINHSYHENGQLASYSCWDKNGGRTEMYNEQGTRTDLTIVTKTSENSSKTYVNAVEEDGFKMHFIQEDKDGRIVYRMYLYDDETPAELNRYDEQGRRILDEYYDRSGNVTNRVEYTYNADGSYSEKYLDGSIYYYDKDGNFLRQE